MGGEIENRRGHTTHIDDVAPGGPQALDQRLLQLGTGVAAVASDHDGLLATLVGFRTDGASNLAHDVGAEPFLDNATHIVGAENFRRHLDGADLFFDDNATLGGRLVGRFDAVG